MGGNRGNQTQVGFHKLPEQEVLWGSASEGWRGQVNVSK